MDIRLIDANALYEEAFDRLSEGEVLYGFSTSDIDDAPTYSLNTLRDAIYQDAVEHGLWDEGVPYPLDYCCELINDELKKLAEEADNYEYKKASMDGFIEKLADIIIISMSIAGLHCIDIDAAIRRKMEINKGRAWKHGKE